MIQNSFLISFCPFSSWSKPLLFIVTKQFIQLMPWVTPVVVSSPTNRKILNDLSSDAPAVPRIEEEEDAVAATHSITTVTMPTPIYQTSSGQYSRSTNVAGRATIMGSVRIYRFYSLFFILKKNI